MAGLWCLLKYSSTGICFGHSVHRINVYCLLDKDSFSMNHWNHVYIDLHFDILFPNIWDKVKQEVALGYCHRVCIVVVLCNELKICVIPHKEYIWVFLQCQCQFQFGYQSYYSYPYLFLQFEYQDLTSHINYLVFFVYTILTITGTIPTHWLTDYDSYSECYVVLTLYPVWDEPNSSSNPGLLSHYSHVCLWPGLLTSASYMVVTGSLLQRRTWIVIDCPKWVRTSIIF